MTRDERPSSLFLECLKCEFFGHMNIPTEEEDAQVIICPQCFRILDLSKPVNIKVAESQ